MNEYTIKNSKFSNAYAPKDPCHGIVDMESILHTGNTGLMLKKSLKDKNPKIDIKRGFMIIQCFDCYSHSGPRATAHDLPLATRDSRSAPGDGRRVALSHKLLIGYGEICLKPTGGPTCMPIG